MASAVLGIQSKGVLRFSRWDALFVALAALHGVVLAEWPTATVIAIGVWWNANTIAHNFIHRPFFRARFLNLIFSAYLSVLLGIPQSLWRDRHLAHHAGVRWRLRGAPQLFVEIVLVIGLWTFLALADPRFLLTVYLPGYLIGLGLCTLQGRYEHARGVTSHYGWIYNLVCFNDGYHVEHHANPAIHWSELPARAVRGARVSRWPALLRWLDCASPGGPGGAMRGASLLLVFVLAKVAVLSGHTLPLSFWTPAAYFWQDILVALVFAALDAIARKIGLTNRPAWLVYWALAVYAAVNIPVGRVLSTPLTWPMLCAARGPLADSLLLYVTWTNTSLVLLTLCAAAMLPFLLRSVPRGFVLPAAAGAFLIPVIGPAAGARVETLGLDRNVVVALISSALPRVHSVSSADDWRMPPRVRSGGLDELSGLRGIAKGRNVVLVSLESTAAQYLSLYGGKFELTPHLSALARNAVVFENAYAVYPESIKGLFSILCATFPAFDSKAEMYENVPCRSVAAILADSGYRTGLFHSGRFAYLGMESIIRHRGYETLEDAGDIGGNHKSSFGVDEPSTVARILSWIDARPHGERFFLTYLPIAGHHPYETPERGPFPDREEIGRYRNALRYGDASLGALVDGLRARGLAENTLWVILGDHGEAFGQHEGNFGHTFFLYDENVRVPFVIAAPGLMHGQMRVRKAVSLVDTAPTILDLMGIPPPDSYQGRSMLDSAARMALFFTDYSLGMIGLRDGAWKFVYELESSRSRMFDVERDLFERTDVAARNAELAARYGRIVRGWSGAQKSYVARWNRR